MDIHAVDTRTKIQDFFAQYAARFNTYLQREELDVEDGYPEPDRR